MSLVEFLTARLDEDEAVARDAHYEGQRWISEEEGVWRWPDDEAVHTADRKRDAAHIARHDPPRVLADVAAKRAILRNHGDQHDCGDPRSYDYPYVGCCDLRQLAMPYADHPDYRDEWKP